MLANHISHETIWNQQSGHLSQASVTGEDHVMKPIAGPQIIQICEWEITTPWQSNLAILEKKKWKL